MAVFFLCWIGLAMCSGLAVNTHAEYCAYVNPGEPYHLILDDTPCRLTPQFFLELGILLTIIAVFSLAPVLIVWINVTCRQWRKKKSRPQASSSGDHPQPEGN